MKFNRRWKNAILCSTLGIVSVIPILTSVSTGNSLTKSSQSQTDSEYLKTVRNNNIFETLKDNEGLHTESSDLLSQSIKSLSKTNPTLTSNAISKNVKTFNQNLKTSTENNSESNSKILEYVKKESNFYLDKIYKESFTLSDLAEMANKSGYSYLQQENDLNHYQLESTSDSTTNAVAITSQQNRIQTFAANFTAKKASYFLDSLNESGIKSAYFAAAAAALAAGYWAASWFFGITIPAATAATAQAVAFGTEGAIYGISYLVFKKNPSYLKIADLYVFLIGKNILWSKEAYSSITHIKEWISNIKGEIHSIKLATSAIKVSIGATSWAAPVGLLFLTLGDIVLSICNLIFDF